MGNNKEPLFEIDGIEKIDLNQQIESQELEEHLLTQVVIDNADDAYAKTLASVLNYGEEVSAGESLSTGAGKKSVEIINFGAKLLSPRDRLIYNKAKRINLPAAVARFIWMMAASDRLADISFYEPKAAFFTDDEISMPGSNYGQRMLQPRPGLNQLRAVIKRLKEDSQSRRAAISIYHPEDAVRDSRDIPCTFGLFYHVRAGKLMATTVMRSNNAFILMPYNLFEFSLLAEVVAVELGYPLGTLTHFAVSMHVYDFNIEDSKKVIASYEKRAETDQTPIPQIPEGSQPLEQISKLIKLEVDLRHHSQGLTGNNIEEWISKGEDGLEPYWQQFYFLLLLYVVTQKSVFFKSNLKQREIALESIKSVLTDPWKSYLPETIFDITGNKATSIDELVPLEVPGTAGGAQIILFHEATAHKRMQKNVAAFEEKNNTKVTWEEFVKLESLFGDRIAARDGLPFEYEEIEKAIIDLRSNDKE